MTSQYNKQLYFQPCSVDVCYTKNDADDSTKHRKQCPSREGDVLVTKEEERD